MRTKPKNVLIDNVAVRRRIAGDHDVELTREERRRAIRVLHRAGSTDTEIAKALGYARERIKTARKRMELPPNPDPTKHSQYGLPRHNARRKVTA